MQQGGGATSEQVVEEASPISSRPPAANLDELMRFSADDAGGGGRGGGGGSSSTNRWPREETLTLLRIRSEMDAAFRDASVKGPLWEDVSRKLSEVGYKRSAKKCKEKFENVQKYYKRTREGRSGRQDGKTYKFFSQLEALNTATAATTFSMETPPPLSTLSAAASNTLHVAPFSVGFLPHNQPLSTVGMTSSPYAHLTAPASLPAVISFGSAPEAAAPPAVPAIPVAASFGITFSSHSFSTDSSLGHDDDEMEDIETSNGGSRKRKSHSARVVRGSRSKMMEFFQGLMRQILEKQEAMQRSFLEAIERREQERFNREEAWKRQEMARLAQEHQLMAQDRAASASRDAVVVSLIQKITGQTIQLPPPTPPQSFQLPPTVAARPPPITTPPPHHPPIPSPLQQQQQQQQQQSHNQSSGVPFQDTGGSGSSEPASSRWPKAEVLTLINIRSGLESKYQEVCPKGPLWEEISSEMKHMGYNRSAKRCKEKWENINKYYKKVKESNKKRPEDAKTCPYFPQLDALYRNKALLGSRSFSTQHRPQQEQQSSQHAQESIDADPIAAMTPSASEGIKDEAAKKPEDLVMELIEQQGMQRQQELQPVMVDDYDKMDEPHGSNLARDDDDDDDGKMGYKIVLRKRSTGGSNRGGNDDAAPSFLTMVQ